MTAETEVRLEIASSSATISKLGAEPREWLVEGQSLLWSGDPAWWGQRSPILFPVVGWTRNAEMRIKGKRYPLALHGFAAKEQFELLLQTKNSATFRLLHNEATHALYPFAFELLVEYRLDETKLTAKFMVHNRGKEPMPYALGLHPGFVLPLPGAGTGDPHRVVFGKGVSPEVPVIAPGGLISARRRSLPLEGGVLQLSPELFANDALCFLDAAATDLAFENGRGDTIAISAEAFPHMALWTKPGAPFLCIECWTGYSDPEGFEGDIFDKPSMRVLLPDEMARHAVTYEWRSAR